MVAIEATPGRKEAQCAMIELHLRRGEPERAAELLAELRVQVAQHGPYLEARERILTARVLLAVGGEAASEQAEHAAEAARVLCLAHGFISLEVEALALLGWLRAARGAFAEASAAIDAASARLNADVSVERPAAVRMLLARSYERVGAHDEAARVWEAARDVAVGQVERVRGEAARERFRATREVAELLTR